MLHQGHKQDISSGVRRVAIGKKTPQSPDESTIHDAGLNNFGVGTNEPMPESAASSARLISQSLGEMIPRDLVDM